MGKKNLQLAELKTWSRVNPAKFISLPLMPYMIVVITIAAAIMCQNRKTDHSIHK